MKVWRGGLEKSQVEKRAGEEGQRRELRERAGGQGYRRGLEERAWRRGAVGMAAREG
jgi:hypothetical protein